MTPGPTTTTWRTPRGYPWARWSPRIPSRPSWPTDTQFQYGGPPPAGPGVRACAVGTGYTEHAQPRLWANSPWENQERPAPSQTQHHPGDDQPEERLAGPPHAEDQGPWPQEHKREKGKEEYCTSFTWSDWWINIIIPKLLVRKMSFIHSYYSYEWWALFNPHIIAKSTPIVTSLFITLNSSGFKLYLLSWTKIEHKLKNNTLPSSPKRSSTCWYTGEMVKNHRINHKVWFMQPDKSNSG